MTKRFYIHTYIDITMKISGESAIDMTEMFVFDIQYVNMYVSMFVLR